MTSTTSRTDAGSEPGSGPAPRVGRSGLDPGAEPATAMDQGPRGRTTVLAFVLFGVVLVEVATSVVGSWLAGLSFANAADSFIVTNVAIGLSCGLAGVLIAWQRPRNPVGWLLLAAGICQSATAAFAPFVVLGLMRGWPEPVIRSLITGFSYAWPWSIALFLPLALLVFPEGLLPGRFWRATWWFTVLASPVFVLALGADPAGDRTFDGPPLVAWVVLADYERLAPLWRANEVANLAVLVVIFAGLVIRYRRGDDRRRRQLLWLVLALLLMIIVLVPWELFAPVVWQLLAIALVPAAITIAVLRHQLLDIRLVLSRTVLYGLLTAGVIAAYLGLVAVADSVLRQGPGTSVLATLLVAVGFNPVRVRLQRVVDRALYGDRADPVRALSRMGSRLSGGTDADSGDVLAAVCEALRLPYAALRRDGADRAVHGAPPELLEVVALSYRGERVGELVVGVRAGQRRLDGADRAALELLAAPLAVAVHATALSEAVQRSREAIVAAREEERRRLRRDLHDGLGPALTGIAFQADAAGNLVPTDPGRAVELIGSLRAAATEAIADVRRLVYGLRPPALDELGLVGALRRHAEQLGEFPVVTVHAQDLPPLPAAVEVAAYRIAVEALTNAVRHAGASRIDVRVDVNGALEVTVDDDGAGQAGWEPGVGMASMRERAAELGGSVRAGPVPDGGRVSARLPL